MLVLTTSFKDNLDIPQYKTILDFVAPGDAGDRSGHNRNSLRCVQLH